MLGQRLTGPLVRSLGGVAWAKQAGDEFSHVSGFVQRMIDGYTASHRELSAIQNHVLDFRTQLASAWSGDAADAANHTFTRVANDAGNVCANIEAAITQLTAVQHAAATAASRLAALPDELPAPHVSFPQQAAIDLGLIPDPRVTVESHNAAACTEAAESLNDLNDSYHRIAETISELTEESRNFFTTYSEGQPFELSDEKPSTSRGNVNFKFDEPSGESYAQLRPKTTRWPIRNTPLESSRSANIPGNHRTGEESGSTSINGVYNEQRDTMQDPESHTIHGSALGMLIDTKQSPIESDTIRIVQSQSALDADRNAGFTSEEKSPENRSTESSISTRLRATDDGGSVGSTDDRGLLDTDGPTDRITRDRFQSIDSDLDQVFNNTAPNWASSESGASSMRNLPEISQALLDGEQLPSATGTSLEAADNSSKACPRYLREDPRWWQDSDPMLPALIE